MCQQCSYVMLEYSDSLGISHFNITLIIMSRPFIDLIKWCPLKNVNFNYEKLCDSIFSMDSTYFLFFFMLFNVQVNISEVTQVQDQLLRVHASLSLNSWVPCLPYLSPRYAFFLMWQYLTGSTSLRMVYPVPMNLSSLTRQTCLPMIFLLIPSAF